jgi:hypothetical protein
MRATAILGSCATVVHPAGNGFDLSGHGSALEAILEILVRHPMSEEQVERALAHSSPEQAAETLATLASSGRARRVTHHGVHFWTAAEQHFIEAGEDDRAAWMPPAAEGRSP